MTDELQPLPEPEPLHEPVVEDLDGEQDEGFDLVEPENVTRLSPFAVASFIVAIFGAFEVPSIVSAIAFSATDKGPGPVAASFVRALIEAAGPLCFSGVALWLARRAEDEIFLGERRLGGVGFYRAAWIVSLVAITLLVLALVGGIVAYSITSHHATTFP